MHKEQGVILLVAALVVSLWLTGCGFNRGWRFEIGVSPVSNLENKAGLKEHNENGN